MLFAVILGGGFAIGSLFYSDKIALRTAGAREVGPNDGEMARRLHGTVDRLCALADMKKPRVAIADTDCRTPSRPAATPTTRCSA